MARLIDADLLLKELDKYIVPTQKYGFLEGISTAVTEIKEQPTADVKEVVRGEWEVIGKGRFRCSHCGADEYRHIVSTNECIASCCWNCGADMRKE